MKNKMRFVSVFFLLFFLIFAVPLAQASPINNIWHKTLAFLGIIEITKALSIDEPILNSLMANRLSMPTMATILKTVNIPTAV